MMKLIKIIVFLACVTGLALGAANFCWKKGYTRANLPQCAPGSEKILGQCYTSCNAGYIGNGSTCTAQCQGNMTDNGASCQKQSYPRGAGRIPCDPGLQKDGPYCYPPCTTGYVGYGSLCLGNCPDGWSSIGNFTGRNCCCLSGGDCNFCPIGNKHYGCLCAQFQTLRDREYYVRPTYDTSCAADEVMDLGLCYKKCLPGFTAKGQNCLQNCVGETIDANTTCTKKTYDRGASVPPTCNPGETFNQNGYCYKSCNPGDAMVGDFCWSSSCPAGFTDCGAGCGRTSGADCTGKNFATNSWDGQVSATIAALVADTAKVNAKLAQIEAKMLSDASFVDNVEYFVSLMRSSNANTALSQADAITYAKNEVAAMMLWIESGGQPVDLSPAGGGIVWNYVFSFDWTGSIAATNGFFNPICNTI